MLYRCLILQDDQNPSKVIDEVMCYRWDDIPKAITNKGHATKNFVVYEGQPTEENSIKWVEVGAYRLQD